MNLISNIRTVGLRDALFWRLHGGGIRITADSLRQRIQEQDNTLGQGFMRREFPGCYQSALRVRQRMGAMLRRLELRETLVRSRIFLKKRIP